jgi:hypothetical protein
MDGWSIWIPESKCEESIKKVPRDQSGIPNVYVCDVMGFSAIRDAKLCTWHASGPRAAAAVAGQRKRDDFLAWREGHGGEKQRERLKKIMWSCGAGNARDYNPNPCSHRVRWSALSALHRDPRTPIADLQGASNLVYKILYLLCAKKVTQSIQLDLSFNLIQQTKCHVFIPHHSFKLHGPR